MPHGLRVRMGGEDEMDETRALIRLERCALGREWLEIGGPSVLQVTQGELLVGAGEELERAVAGDLVSVAPGARRRARAARGTAHAERLEIDSALVRSALELCAVEATGSAGGAVDRRGTDRARRGAKLLRELAAAHGAGTDAGRLRCAGLCVELLALIAEAEPATVSIHPVGRRASERSERFRLAVDELRNLPLDDVTLPSFARGAGVSQRHVSRLFQCELGVTFREHVAGLRLERAKALLRETGMSVIEVAGETGWSSLAHFNAVFRRRVGATPSCYRSTREAPPRAERPTRRASACSQAPRHGAPG